MSQRQWQQLVLNARQPSVLMPFQWRTRRYGRQCSRVLHRSKWTVSRLGPLPSMLPRLFVRLMPIDRFEPNRLRWRLSACAVKLARRQQLPVHGPEAEWWPEPLWLLNVCAVKLAKRRELLVTRVHALVATLVPDPLL